MSAYVESFIPPHRRRSLPLEYASLEGLPGGLSDLSCCCDDKRAIKATTGLGDLSGYRGGRGGGSRGGWRGRGGFGFGWGGPIFVSQPVVLEAVTTDDELVSVEDLSLGDLGEDQAAPGLLQSFAGGIKGVLTGTGPIQNRIAKGVAGTAVRGARFRSQFTSPIYLTPEQIFGSDQVAEPSQSTYSIMGVIKPGVELETVAGTFKVFPWGEPSDGQYLIYLVGGAVAVVATGALACKLFSKLF